MGYDDSRTSSLNDEKCPPGVSGAWVVTAPSHFHVRMDFIVWIETQTSLCKQPNFTFFVRSNAFTIAHGHEDWILSAVFKMVRPIFITGSKINRNA